jgi:hypothetical protein
VIPAAYTGHVSTVVSIGSEIVWSGGATDADDNLFRYMPGSSDPELVYRNPRRDSILSTIAGSSAGYVFTDDRWASGQPRGWRLWYLTEPGATPILLDQSTDDRLPSPTLAMSDRYIAWAVVHGTWRDRLNELRVAPISDPTHPTTLLSIPGRDHYVEFPALWNDELWYGIADNDWDAGTEAPRIEMIDLVHPAAKPSVYGADQRAFMPAPGRDVVAWKSGGQEGSSGLNSGALTLYWRASGMVEALHIPGPDTAADRVSYPSVGNRFVAWWDDIRPRLYVYDLVERQFRRIAEFDWAGDELIGKPSLSSNLLTYIHSRGEGDRSLEWATLPD